MEDNLKSKEDINLTNATNPENSKLNKDNIIYNKKEQDQNNSENIKEEKKENPINLNNSTIKENINSASNNEKTKRFRRGKNGTSSERTYKCPDCEKCYLSGPALVIHRKLKHGYNTENEKKSRGRPKKEDQQENAYLNAQIKYNVFLNNSTRKKNDENEENKEKEIINLELIQDNFNNIYRQCKSDLFSKIENIEKYPFYQLVINNWNKENYDFPKQCLCDNNKSENHNNSNKYNSPPLDQIFFLYLKELSSKTNKNYFWFINKFIILLRECINSFKKDLVKVEYKTEMEYSQLFSAEGVPESFNDFFLEFMQPKEYYGLNEGELIELAQHFCFWLYSNKYTHSYLTLL